MSPDPWRPQDIADEVLGRSSRPPMPHVTLEGAEVEGDFDEVYIIMHELPRGIQPVAWPMKTHRHTQECRRA